MDKLKQGLKWFFNSYIWLGILLLIIDIVTKNIIVNYGQEIQSANQYATHGSTYNNGGINLIPGFLGINYLINENIAFGLMIGNKQLTQILFSIVAMIVVIGIVIYLIKKWDKTNRYYKACLMMIIAGALGNVIDRIFYSPEYLNYVNEEGELARGVVDWIDFYGIWGFNFNIADSCVVVAAFMLIGYVIYEEIRDYRAKKKDEKDNPKEEIKEEKVLSQTEKEKQKLLEEGKEKDE